MMWMVGMEEEHGWMLHSSMEFGNLMLHFGMQFGNVAMLYFVGWVLVDEYFEHVQWEPYVLLVLVVGSRS